ncbi:hypothetical protein ILYODFUR_036414 [Ilyodon furcidens]|uniref:Secreted protein n=1 Tax=Ilyodon furcidens TaxID=33524 RepID=A0ABV0ST64_9TELE
MLWPPFTALWSRTAILLIGVGSRHLNIPLDRRFTGFSPFNFLRPSFLCLSTRGPPGASFNHLQVLLIFG